MTRQKKTTYARLTPKRRFQMLEEIRVTGAAWIAAGMPSDSPEPEEEEIEGGGAAGGGAAAKAHGEVDPIEGDVIELEEEPQPVAGFAMEGATAEFEHTQAVKMVEQTAILESI